MKGLAVNSKSLLSTSWSLFSLEKQQVLAMKGKVTVFILINLGENHTNRAFSEFKEESWWAEGESYESFCEPKSRIVFF